MWRNGSHVETYRCSTVGVTTRPPSSIPDKPPIEYVDSPGSVLKRQHGAIRCLSAQHATRAGDADLSLLAMHSTVSAV